MSTSARHGELTAELRTNLVRELANEWHALNDGLFRGTMKAPQILLVPGHHHLGRYEARDRALSISETFVLTQGWRAAVEVLKHEMAHQFVFEVLGIGDETAHGPAFRDVCDKRGIDPRAAGVPTPGAGPDDRTLERVAKLLALAESSSQHEAEAAMNAAQRLMLKYNLDRAAVAGPRAYEFRTVGEPTGRVSEAERWLAHVLTKHFFVEGIWVHVYRPLEGKRASVFEISGTRENLEMAEYVHAFLTHAAERAWVTHKKARNIRSNKLRRAFLAGVMSGFESKLAEQARDQAREGLVWVGDPDLKAYSKKRHPHVTRVRYGGTGGTAAHHDGQAAGRGLVLHRPVTSGSSGSTPLLGS
jgi:hypothetical protein